MKFLTTLFCLSIIFILPISSPAHALVTPAELAEFCATLDPDLSKWRFRQPNDEKALKSVTRLGKGITRYENGITIEIINDDGHYKVILPSGDVAAGCSLNQLSEILRDNKFLPKKLGGDGTYQGEDMKILSHDSYDLVKYYPR
jgi:hypothetical protein